MNIIYLHGLSSSGQSNTAKTLRALLPEDNVISPDIPVDPIEALQMLLELAGKYSTKDTIIVGTSMGGMYAFQMKGFRRILVNPALHVSDFLRKNVGTALPFFNKRKDEIKSFRVTDELCSRVSSMENSLWLKSLEDKNENILVLFGDNDEVCDEREDFNDALYFWSEFQGGHRLNEKVIKEVLIPVIEWAKEHQDFIPETIEHPFSEVQQGDMIAFYEGEYPTNQFKVYDKGIGRQWFDRIRSERKGETLPDGRVASFIFPKLPEDVREETVELVYGNRYCACPTVEIYGHGNLALTSQEIKIGNRVFTHD